MIGLLAPHRDAARRGWMRRILATYPSETQTFLAGESDPFHNPVGAALERGTAAILGYLLEGGDRDALAAELQQLIRIRAVQQFTSSQAIGFVFLLKDEVRERLGDEVAARGLHGEQLAFESGIDEVAMVCAELYVQAREQLFQSQLKSVHRQTHKLVERMNKMKRSPREGGGSDEEPVA